MASTVRISGKAYEILQNLAKQDGVPMQSVLDAALERYRRIRFLEGLNADYESLRQKPEEWAAYKSEVTAWDATLMDGLDREENWFERRDGRAVSRRKPAR